MEFRVAGPLEVLTERRPVALGGMRPRGLLASLLLRRNVVAPRDQLIDLLWENPRRALSEHSKYTCTGCARRSAVQRLLTQSQGTC